MVQVSSILPAGMTQQKSVDVEEGSELHVAYAEITSRNPGEIVSAAVSVGIPVDKSNIGVIMEQALFDKEKETVKKVESMVKEAMANRGYEIEQIVTCSCEATTKGNGYTTVFAGLAMW